MDNTDILNEMTRELDKHNLPESTKKVIYDAILKLTKKQLNILLVGGTGVGKSSTINALFNSNVAKIGLIDPETMEITKYALRNNLVLWDSPGIGDTPQRDERYKQQIINKLRETNLDGTALIDLVLVVVNGSSRDMDSIYKLVNHVLIPNLENFNSVIIAINQCDQILKGKGWNYQTNKPQAELEIAIKEKEESVRKRIEENTGVKIVQPISYSAEYRYNLAELLHTILRNSPDDKPIRGKEKCNVLLVSQTGAGKSTTINALFNMEVAKVGRGVDPETMEIAKYELRNNLVLWDSPGTGVAPQTDERHKKQITNKLRESNSDGTALIDLVLVVVDGSSRDMGLIYDLLIDVLIPNVEYPKNIIFAINQCDQIWRGRGWNYQTNKPQAELEIAIKEKEESVRKRIEEFTGVKIVQPISYSAEYRYNLAELLRTILRNSPDDKHIRGKDKSNILFGSAVVGVGDSDMVRVFKRLFKLD